MTRLTALFGAIPYAEGAVPQYEHEWGTQVFLVLQLIGAYTESEVHVAGGRIDCVVKTHDFIYVFEYKLNGSTAEAFDQIERRGYIVPYAADKRTLYRVAVVFSEESRNISTWAAKDRAGNDCKKLLTTSTDTDELM